MKKSKKIILNSYERQQSTYDIERVEDGEDYKETIVNADLGASGTYSSIYDD